MLISLPLYIYYILKYQDHVPIPLVERYHDMLIKLQQYHHLYFEILDHDTILMVFLYLILPTTQLQSIQILCHSQMEYYLVYVEFLHLIPIKPILDVQVYLSQNHHTINQVLVNVLILNSVLQYIHIYFICQDYDKIVQVE